MKVDIRPDIVTVFIGALHVEINRPSFFVWRSARDNVLINAIIRDLLLYCEARERVEVRITLGENVRSGASVVVQGLELVGDRGIEKRVGNVQVSFMEFYYHDFAGVDGSAVIVGIVVIIIVSVSVTALALGEGRIGDEGWKGGEGGGGFEVVHHFS